jgi:hypothetical protein
VPPLPPPVPHRSVTSDLIDWCFNCLRQDHMAVTCTRTPCYLRCHKEGHLARSCKWPRLPDATGPPCPQRPTVVVLNPRAGDIVIAAPADKRPPHPPRGEGSDTLSDPSFCSMSSGSPSCHDMPSLPSSPPLPPAPLGALHRRPTFEMRVIPQTAAMTAAEDELSRALVAYVGGSRPSISPELVSSYLLRHHGVMADKVRIRRYKVGSFILSFNEDRVDHAVLHAHLPVGFDLILIFTRYRRHTDVIFKLLCFKVLLTVENIPAHSWLLKTTQAIIGSSYLIFNVTPSSASGEDLSSFWAVAWATHRDLIPAEVGCIFPEPVELFVERAPPLFLSASELIHSKLDTLQLRN